MSGIGIGIVHFGPGAFHRAHQADYIDRLLKTDERWGIAAVSLRSAETIEALARQQGRYTLAITGEETSFRTIRAHRSFLGPGQGAHVRQILQDPAVRLVTTTVTEKGYCLRGDGTLDVDHPDIVRDLARPSSPASIVGWLTLGLADRRANGLAPFTPLCCDNMASNGRKLRSAVIAYAALTDPELARWIAGEAVFPNTMVDSITPATDDRLRAEVLAQTGFADAIPVSREPYAAWIVENVLPAGSPDLTTVGVTLAPDIAAWEKAKLRIVNGAHSTLAYLGLLIGHETVADAMCDAGLAGFVERLVRDEIVPCLRPSPLDLDTYANDVMERFRNPAIGHMLSQIAWDGSQKLPYRLFDTLIERRAAGRPTTRLVIAIAAWTAFVERQSKRSETLVDPLAEPLFAAIRTSDPVTALLSLRQVFPPSLADDAHFQAELGSALVLLRDDPRSALTTS